MPRRSRRTGSVDQLGLSLRGEGFEGPFEARGVFSTTYLARHLRSAQEFASEHDVAQVFHEIAEIWRARVTALSRSRSNVAFTCSELLEPIVDLDGDGKMEVVAGLFDGSRQDLEEVYRFDNGGVQAAGGMYWPLMSLWQHVTRGLRAAGKL